ncbi:uncharacterized protein LOC132048797 [Lycium ferocissimum]|uniref:uncharacterized protein LOC132048797 n=1 Tax=Lycium ferocissimum TaxID=112874 RepID=UPI0028157D7B|nr:uncharacterized protein LOC132048797 [Lycium ferocissimum]
MSELGVFGVGNGVSNENNPTLNGVSNLRNQNPRMNGTVPTQQENGGNSRNQYSNQARGIDYNHSLFLSPQINKLGLVDGTCSKDKFPEEMWNRWERVNAIVLSWVMNSVSKNLLGGIMYASIVQTVWEELLERFNKIDGSRTFNLHKEISTLTQGATSVFVYFTKIKNLWEEFESLVPAPGCECPRCKFNQCIGNFELAIHPRNNRNQGNNHYGTGNQSHSPYGNQKFKKPSNYNLIGEFCKCKGHSKDSCYKLIGYPPDFKSKKGGMDRKTGPNPGYGVAYNVLADNTISENGTQSQNQFGHNAAVLTYGQTSQAINSYKFKEGSNMVLKMPLASAAGVVEDVALIAPSSNPEWIIDTRATNHMTSNPDLLTEETIKKAEVTKKVHLPNGDVTQVSHTGNSVISKTSTISNVFLIPQFKYNLLNVIVREEIFPFKTKDTAANCSNQESEPVADQSIHMDHDQIFADPEPDQ